MRNLKSATRLLLVLACSSSSVFAAPILGSAQEFGVLGASPVINSGSTTVQGDIGFTSTLIGQDGITLMGAVHENDAVSQQAKIDARKAYNALKAQSFTTDLTGWDLGTVGILTPGVYRFDSLAQLTGSLTLDAQGDPDAQFIFQIGSALVTASNAVVNVINGGANTGLFWQVGNSAILGDGTLFAGNIIADQSIVMNTAAKILCGRAIALEAAVLMADSTISNDCAAFNDGTSITDFGSKGFSSTAVPVPAATWLFASGLFGLANMVRRKRKSIG